MKKIISSDKEEIRDRTLTPPCDVRAFYIKRGGFYLLIAGILLGINGLIFSTLDFADIIQNPNRLDSVLGIMKVLGFVSLGSLCVSGFYFLNYKEK